MWQNVKQSVKAPGPLVIQLYGKKYVNKKDRWDSRKTLPANKLTYVASGLMSNTTGKRTIQGGADRLSRNLWRGMPLSQTKTRQSDIDIENLEDTGKKREYQKAARKNYLEDPQTPNTQRQWNHIVKSCLNAGKAILGKKERGKKTRRPRT